MLGSLRSKALGAVRSEFGRNAAWFAALSAGERVIAVIQTIVIARVLGITDYGVYGFLFGTIGFVASVAGLQMGLTATVYISRYKVAEKARAAAVIAIVQRFGLIVALVSFAVVVPFSHRISDLLLGSSQYQLSVAMGTLLIGATIVSGVQDGIAQGFEMFRALAKLKVITSLLTLLSIYPVASHFGLDGVLAVVVAGLALKFTILARAVTQARSAADIPAAGAGETLGHLLTTFALPSMTVSLAVGFVTWLGTFLLSRMPSGFDELAFVNTGLQWRGPVLLLAATLGGVAIPAFSQLAGRRDLAGAARLRRSLLIVNLGIAVALAVPIVAVSGLLLKLYGAGFEAGKEAFAVIVLSSVPTVIANVYMQELVGSARMWRQLWLHTPFLVVMTLAFALLVPRYYAVGYAYSLLAGSLVFLSHVLLAIVTDARRSGRAASEH